MPHALARAGVQREHAVAEQIGALAIAAPEIKRRRAKAGKHDAALGVQRHARPAVGAAGGSPRVAGPCVVAEFAGLGNGVEDPPALPGARVVGADVARRFRVRTFPAASSDDQQILEDHRRAGVAEGEAFHFVIEIVIEIDRAFFAKLVVELAGYGIDTIDAILHGGEDALVPALLEIGDAPAVSRRAAGAFAAERIVGPLGFAGGGVDRPHLELGRGKIHDAVDDDGRALHRGGRALLCVAGVMNPGDLQVLDVFLVNARRGRIARGIGIAAVEAPFGGCGSRLGRDRRGCRGGRWNEFTSAHMDETQYSRS